MYQGYIDIVSARSPIDRESNGQHRLGQQGPELRLLSMAFSKAAVTSKCGRRVVHIQLLLKILAQDDLQPAIEKFGHLVFKGLAECDCASSEMYLPKESYEDLRR